MLRPGMAAAAVVVAAGLSLATAAGAQVAPAFTVTFGGQLRVLGLAFENLRDFQDTRDGRRFCTRIGTVDLDGSVVYGQRQLYSAALDRNVEESGFGLQVTARVPLGPVSTWWHALYTTGDERRIVGTDPGVAASAIPGRDYSTASNTTRLNQDSDKLPIPIGGTSWLGAPFVGEALIHGRTTGNTSFGQPLYNDVTGTWGIGASATYALLPA